MEGRVAIWRSISADLALAWRLLWKAPGLSAVVVVCLATATGFATAAFTVVHGAFLSPLPVPGGARIVTVQEYHRAGSYNVPLTPAQFTLRRERSRSFDALGAWYSRKVTLDDDGGASPRVVQAAYMSANAFDVLEVGPVLGRLPSASDVNAGAAPVAVIGEALWHSRFGGDPAIVGRSIRIAGAPHVVIGVMRGRFAFPFREELWIPAQMNPAAANVTREPLLVFGRLREGVSRGQAAAELSVIAGSERTRDEEATVPLVMPFTRGFMSPEQEWAMFAFILGLLAFLAVTAANLANLFLARNSARVREIALRSALGAGRARLVRQLLVESLMLGTAGACAGLGFARAALAWFQGRVVDLPWWSDFDLDAVVLGFVVLCGLLATAISGIGPALRLTRPSMLQALHEGGRSATGLRFSRLAAGLLLAQVAVSVAFLSVVSVLAQGLLGFTFERYQIPGREVLVAQVYLGPPEAAELARPGADRRMVWQQHHELSRQHFEAIMRMLEQEPGVRHVTLATHFPGNDREAVLIQLQSSAGSGTGPVSTRFSEIGPDFFETLGASLVVGRDFTAAERLGAPQVVIVNAPFVRRHFPGESPLGRSIRLAGDASAAPGPWLEIIGVVPDLGLSPGDPGRADGIYLPFSPSNFARFGIRTNAEPATLIPRVHEIVRREYPAAQVQSVESLAAQMDTAEAVFRSLGLGLMLIGGMSLLLSAVSFYSLISFGVTRRTREIGIRLALGASRRGILKAVLGRELAIVLAGGSTGILLGYGLYQLVANIPFDLRPAGPSLAAIFLALMLVVGVSAGLGPARRALAIDPAETMRQE
jgi:predicted permease